MPVSSSGGSTSSLAAAAVRKANASEVQAARRAVAMSFAACVPSGRQCEKSAVCGCDGVRDQDVRGEGGAERDFALGGVRVEPEIGGVRDLEPAELVAAAALPEGEAAAVVVVDVVDHGVAAADEQPARLVLAHPRSRRR